MVPVMAVGIALVAPSCAEPTATEEARVAGFDHTRDIAYEEQQWQKVEDSESMPWPGDKNVRNARSRVIQDGCRRVYDSWGGEDINGVYSGEEDDWDCAFDFSWNACSTGSEDEMHCEPVKKTVWSYEELVWKGIGECTVEPRGFEVKPATPRTDEECVEVFEALPTKGKKRSESSEDFWIRAEIKDKEGKIRYIMIDMPPEMWAKVRASDCVEVKGPEKKPEQREFVGLCE